MLTRLAKSSSLLQRSSLKASTASRTAQIPTKASRVPKSLASSFLAPRRITAAKLSQLTISKKRYSTEVEIVQSQLSNAIGKANRVATAEFDANILEDLLARNGWELVISDTKVYLQQSFDDADVMVEIMTESIEPPEQNPFGAMTGQGAEGHDHHHSHHHHHEGEEAGLLKGQTDYFNVVVSKKKVGERMVFACHSKEGVLEIDNVTFTEANSKHIVPFSTTYAEAGHDIEKDVHRTRMFHSLPEELQDAFESYLQLHGINHDLAHLIYYSLYKYDLQYDQEWSARGQLFLESQ